MSASDPGPYMSLNGPDVWVPRTVPYREACRVAQDAVQEFDQRAAYRGKTDATLIGFVRDCRCEEVCERRWVDDGETEDRSCEVPAWKFEIVERAR